MKTTPAEKAAAKNWKTFMKHGPGMKTLMLSETYVVARDPDAGKILIGGLGGCGVGQMWYTEEPHHKDKPGYAEAPIQSSGYCAAPENVRRELEAMSAAGIPANVRQ